MLRLALLCLVAVLGVAGGATLASNATTTPATTNYGYDHLTTFVSAGSRRPVALAAPSAPLSPGTQAASEPDRSAIGAGVAAEDAGFQMPGYSSFRAAKRDIGSAGPGNVFDHVVEQSQVGRSGFAPEDVHNPFNLNPVDASINQAKANYYSSIRPFTGGGTVRDWLTGQSFRDQYEFGMDINARLRNGQPLP
jgi:hypothetical protein